MGHRPYPATGGNNTQNFPLFSGSRLTFGYWLDDAHRIAVEGQGFLLQSRSAGFAASSNSTTGSPAMRIPVYNNVPYAPGGACDPDKPTACLIGRTEDGVPISIPGDLYGSVQVTNTLQLWGADGTVVMPSYRFGTWEVKPLLGVRYLNLSEGLHITANLNGLATSALYAGQSGTATDKFDTRNQFFGAVLGLRGATAWGPFTLELSGTMALGVSHEVLSVAGFYQDFGAAFASSSGPYGMFAMPGNSGTFTKIWPMDARLGRLIAQRGHLTAGSVVALVLFSSSQPAWAQNATRYEALNYAAESSKLFPLVPSKPQSSAPRFYGSLARPIRESAVFWSDWCVRTPPLTRRTGLPSAF
jgi:hypothetical protein